MELKKLIAACLFTFLISLSFGQKPGSNSSPNAKSKTASIERIYGKIVDKGNNKSIEFASIGLFRMPKDSAVAVALSESNGEFSFMQIPYGSYLLRVKLIGYKMMEKELQINSDNLLADIGNISMEPDATILNEIEIKGEKDNMIMAIDRKVFNVGEDLSVSGGTGLDAVKNIPSVSVDMDGTVTLRNSEVQIYIDGRQTDLTLDQIPADQIDRIEIMSNPSSKYDANNSGGLLNVILKKNLKPGYNGAVTLGVGTNERYTPSINFNAKRDPFNLTMMYSYNSESNDNKGKTTRDNLANPDPIQHFEQTSLSDFIRKVHVANVSLDVKLNNRNTITIGERFVYGTYKTIDDQNFISYGPTSDIYSEGMRHNENVNQFQRFNTQLAYKKTFPKKDMELNINGNYSNGSSEGNYAFNTNNRILDSIAPELAQQTNVASGTNQRGTLQIDFSNPINDSTKIEFGLKSDYKESRNINSTANFSEPQNTFLYDSALSNDFLITESVNAAYINYVSRIRKINLQAGLRFEQVSYSGTIANKSNTTFGYAFPNSNFSDVLNSFFPAIYIGRKTGEHHEFQINYTRKLNRPRHYYLLPIVFFADKFNYRIGNPKLQPEFVNKGEINYNFVSPSINYLTAIYGQITENSILYGAYPSAEDENVLVNTFQNGGTSYTLGWENILRITKLKNLTVSTTLTPYFISVNYRENGNNLNNEGFSFNSKLMISYKFPMDFTLQANGTYEAEKPIPQGNKTNLYFFDLSLSKKVKKSFTFNITVSDVLDSKQRGTVYITPEYEQYLIRRRHSRFIRFSATWTFGKWENKQKPNMSEDE